MPSELNLTPLDEGAVFRFRYIPALDGFRVLAIVPVLLVHAGASFMKGGAIGVDLFFALSGFLITSLLLRDLSEHGSIRLGRFWLRRAARLAPALILVVLFVIACSLLLPNTLDPSSTRREAAAALLYVTNWTRIFGLTGDHALVHTWSLGIEEQYYLVWPIMLGILVRVISKRRSLAIWVAILAGGFASWRCILFEWGTSNDRLYEGLDTRADSLLIGSALAILLSTPFYYWLVRRRRSFQFALALALLVLLALAVTTTCHAPFMYRIGYCIVPCCVAVVLCGLLINDERHWLRRLLSLPPFVWMGRISYGIYLWHAPVYFLMGSFGAGGMLKLTLGTAVSVAFATLSFFTVEAYFRKRKDRSVAAETAQRSKQNCQIVNPTRDIPRLAVQNDRLLNEGKILPV